MQSGRGDLNLVTPTLSLVLFPEIIVTVHPVIIPVSQTAFPETAVRSRMGTGHCGRASRSGACRRGRCVHHALRWFRMGNPCGVCWWVQQGMFLGKFFIAHGTPPLTQRARPDCRALLMPCWASLRSTPPCMFNPFPVSREIQVFCTGSPGKPSQPKDRPLRLSLFVDGRPALKIVQQFLMAGEGPNE